VGSRQVFKQEERFVRLIRLLLRFPSIRYQTLTSFSRPSVAPLSLPQEDAPADVPADVILLDNEDLDQYEVCLDQTAIARGDHVVFTPRRAEAGRISAEEIEADGENFLGPFKVFVTRPVESGNALVTFAVEPEPEDGSKPRRKKKKKKELTKVVRRHNQN